MSSEQIPRPLAAPSVAPGAEDVAAWEQFRQLVLANPAWQAALRATRDRAGFVRCALELAATAGCPLTTPAIDAALRASQRAWIERLLTW